MPHFVQIGHRMINLDLVCSAERTRHHVTLYFAVTNPDGDPLSWTFDDPKQIEELWQQISAVSIPPSAAGGNSSPTSPESGQGVTVVISASPTTPPPPHAPAGGSPA